jgi:hypothetical protein
VQKNEQWPSGASSAWNDDDLLQRAPDQSALESEVGHSGAVLVGLEYPVDAEKPPADRQEHRDGDYQAE